MKKYVTFLVFMLLCVPFSLFSKEKKDLSGEYFYIAEAYSELKKYEKAIEFYKKTLDNPEYANAANYNIARMHALLGQWNEAISILKGLHEKEVTNEKILTSYAYALSADGKIEEAENIYKALYEAKKESPSIAFNYVRLLIVAKKYDEASSLLEELNDKFIEDAETKTINELKSTIEKLKNPLKEIKEKEKAEEEKEDKEVEDNNKKDSNKTKDNEKKDDKSEKVEDSTKKESSKDKK
jgi:hypothetical protein